MKKVLQFTVVIAILLACYVAAGPYLTMSAIKSGITTKDSVTLSENIDFQALRQNLKDQFNATMIDTATKQSDDNPFATLASGIATTITDKMIDAIITPNGMSKFLQRKYENSDDKERAEQSEKEEALFKDARFTYDSLSTASVWIPTDDKQEVRMVLQRDALTWKLVNIIAP